MQTESTGTVITLIDNSIEDTPFVNEECGDTMWDEVLANTDGKIEKV